MPARFRLKPLSLLLSTAFASGAASLANAAPCPTGGGLITVSAAGTETCTLTTNNAIQVLSGASIIPTNGGPYGIYAPLGTQVSSISVTSGGTVQVALDNTSVQSVTAISINGPSLTAFNNTGSIVALGGNPNGLSSVAVDIRNTAINFGFINGGYIATQGYDPAVRLTNTLIAGNFANSAGAQIYHHAGPTNTPAVVRLDNVTLQGSFINDGTITDTTPTTTSVVQFNGGSVGGNVSNNGTISDLELSGTQVTGMVVNSGIAREIRLLNGASASSLVTTATGTTKGMRVQSSSTVLHGITNEGTIAITGMEAGAVGIYVQGATVNEGITNTATGVITTPNGIGLRSNGQVNGNIINAGTIASTGSAILVAVNSRLDGDMVNSGTLVATGGTGVNISNSTVTGALSNTGNITAATGIRVSGSSVTGGIENSGTITAPIAISLSGLSAPLTVSNSGMLDGAVQLDTSTLNVNGGTITGPITGNGATVNINTDFTPRDSIDVGTVNIKTGGTLTLANTSIGGPVNVAGGATLAGNGSVGTTTLANGATLSPGTASAPVGSLTVNGDLNFATGSTYRVDANTSGATDTVHVTGVANLAGSVLQVGSNGSYTPSTNYAIVNADGGLQGRFNAVSSNLAYLAPTLSYAGNTVTMNVDLKQVPVDPGTPPDNNTGGNDPGTGTPPDNGGGTAPGNGAGTVPGNGGGTGTDPGPGAGGPTRPIRFADLAITGNQRSVANALQTLPAGSALYTRVLNLPNGAPAAVFESLAGESHASTVSTLQSVSTNVVSLPMAHLRASINAGLLPGSPTAQLGLGDASALPRSAAQPMWAQVFGNWRTLDGNGNAAKTRQTDGGLFVGGDHGVGGGWRLGGALGYTGSHISVDDTSAKADIDSYSAILYGGKAFQAGAGKINLTLGTAYTWHDIKSQRDVDAAGQGQTLKASYGASTTQFFTELGYALPLSSSVTLEPFIAADYSDLRTRGFSESGGDAALNGAGDRNKIGTTTLGLHAQTTFDVGQSAARLHGTVGWRHAYGDVNPETTLSFDGSQSFTVAGAPIARNAAVLELGADMAMNEYATIGVIYTGQFGDGNKQNSGTVTMNWRF